MPSPFPGMDPYLEAPRLWPDFHARLINYVSEQLQEQIRPRYNARIEERIHLVQPRQDYYPDISIIRRPGTQPAPQTIIAEVADEPYLIAQLASEYREPFIQIVYLPTGQVVTTIELLSPINKSGDGRERYLQKQRQILDADASLVEIDLLRGGSHTIAAPEELLTRFVGMRYIVCVSRARRPGEYEVYPATVDARLPRCRIPLRAPDPDAVLDLPAVLDRTYDVSGFEDFINYREPPPPPPLSEAELAWLDARLREMGVRTGAPAE